MSGRLFQWEQRLNWFPEQTRQRRLLVRRRIAPPADDLAKLRFVNPKPTGNFLLLLAAAKDGVPEYRTRCHRRPLESVASHISAARILAGAQ